VVNPTSADVDLAVVGAGPQSLTLLAYLSRYRPDLLERTVVLDPEPWLARWDRQFAAYAIPQLRSACVHHPHPSPYGLIRYARAHGRTGEFAGAIGRPSTTLFRDFCTALIDAHGLEQRRIAVRAVDLATHRDSASLTTSTGDRITARRVVLATNPARPVVPSWLGQARALHPGAPGLLLARDWHEGSEPAARGDVVVVGGGLTAAQIAAAHVRRGEAVTWITRSALRERDLDIEAPWLGPALARYLQRSDPRARAAMARKARGGGSIPPQERAELRALIDSGQIRHLQAPVEQVRAARGGWAVQVRHQGLCRTLHASRVVCATGSAATVRDEPLLRRCRREWPAVKAAGLPALEQDLRWPGTAVHVMGALAMLGVGPACRTVIGARMAAERIVGPMAPRLRRQYPA
jgi:hypothetical protein